MEDAEPKRKLEKEVFTVAIDVETYRLLEQAWRREGMTRNYYIRRLILDAHSDGSELWRLRTRCSALMHHLAGRLQYSPERKR